MCMRARPGEKGSDARAHACAAASAHGSAQSHALSSSAELFAARCVVCVAYAFVVYMHIWLIQRSAGVETFIRVSRGA